MDPNPELVFTAWYTVTANAVKKEIESQRIVLGINKLNTSNTSENVFKFQVLSPVYPTLEPILSAAANPEKQMFEPDMKVRIKQIEHLTAVMNQFLEFRFDASMRYNMKIVPPNFDQNF